MRKPRNWRQWALIAIGVTGAFMLLVLPLILIFQQALSAGWGAVADNLGDPEMQHAIWLTLLATALTVPINVAFGILLAWCVTRYDFRGKQVLTTLVDIPYATSPVVAGLCYLVVYGMESAVGGWLSQHDIQLMFAWPGIVMVTVFVTSPFVARILIPLMQAQGADEEYAALTLGANGWQIFRRITLPNIKWALLYGTVITNARAVGEFGAVSVVSGAIRGQTVTLPLLIEQLSEDYKTVAAFTAAALLACMALLTMVIKTLMELGHRITMRGPAH
ncbi:sulfate ABC transporter permease subunit CysW [Bordetella genomosp. 9]|uniref:Sulfate ABC transporter permease subunit CysW n=1 Tax=Bordetella genomosp. 9 TaxID=1416803 RepID=A0A1W6YVC3_9BORD|nr:sulfate ABC transporter permease subunit CysW [Bordetella genomosp. 9]ARP84961.1 sulfate ABC transporter permease subunit CysW [Bordetella genomosp. 9]ARP89048.1 sulfate ABC transporter permease subunit CysW [Bordetella genomosp. 9]